MATEDVTVGTTGGGDACVTGVDVLAPDNAASAFKELCAALR